MRVLVTGLSTFWGGRVAQELERRPDVEVVVGVDTRDPRIALERTEFVRTDSSYSILSRIVAATQVDTIVHSHLIVDSTRASGRTLHEINVIGTMSLLAAAGASGSPVRKVVLKSSGLVYGASRSDPYFFREEMTRTSPPTTNVERSLLEVEAFLRDFADDSPHVTSRCCASRTCSATISTRRSRSRCAGRSCPRSSASIRACSSCTKTTSSARSCTRPTTTFPASTTWPATATCRGARCARSWASRVPLSPWLTNLAAEPLRRLRLWDLPPEALQLLRFGRTLDNTRYQHAGFRYQYSNAGTVEAFARGLRLAKTIGDKHPTYRYEREVEDFFRHSPAVIRND